MVTHNSKSDLPLICIIVGPACEKAWIYERVPGFELAGYDDRIEKNILTRKECQELCLAEKSKTGLTCRSAEYEYKTYTCRISQVRLFFINTLHTGRFDEFSLSFLFSQLFAFLQKSKVCAERYFAHCGRFRVQFLI